MRLRTRVTAWSYIAMHILGLVAWKLPPQSWRKPHSSDTDPMNVVLALVIPAGFILLWVYLLKKRKWSWWTLVVIFTVSGLATLSSFVTSVTWWGSVIAGFMLLGGIMLRLTELQSEYVALAILACVSFLPLLMLLTDSPRRWHATELTEQVATPHS